MTSIPSPDVKAVVRALTTLTTQVRRIADALSTPVVDAVDTPDDATTTVDDDALRRMLTDALTAEHYRRARERIVASPEEHCAAMADVALRIFSICRAAEATAPATTCSAQHHASGTRLCIRAAHHHGDHIDERGYHWSDTVAVYPLVDSTVRIAHWHPVAGQLAEKRQELAGMVDEFIDAQVQHARAADEEKRTDRRASLHNLLVRATRGALTTDECAMLWRHTAAEQREADAARIGAKDAYQALGARTAQRDQARGERDRSDEAARQALEQRQEMAQERYALQEQRDTADRLRAEVQRDRDQHAAVLNEVLQHFTEHGHPGAPCIRTSWVRTDTVDRWRSVVAPTVERPWWKQVAAYEKEAVEATKHVLELKAAIERVRHLVTGAAQTTAAGLSDHDIGQYDMAVAVLAALDSTEQPTTTEA